MLEDKEVAVWWPKHKIADAAEQERKRRELEATVRLANAKKVALAKLTKEEKKILGVK